MEFATTTTDFATKNLTSSNPIQINQNLKFDGSGTPCFIKTMSLLKTLHNTCLKTKQTSMHVNLDDHAKIFINVIDIVPITRRKRSIIPNPLTRHSIFNILKAVLETQFIL